MAGHPPVVGSGDRPCGAVARYLGRSRLGLGGPVRPDSLRGLLLRRDTGVWHGFGNQSAASPRPAGAHLYQGIIWVMLWQARSGGHVCEDMGRAVPKRFGIGVVDDDAAVRAALKGLLRAAGFSVAVFSSAEEFLASGEIDDTACLILDVRMPGMSGFDLLERLKASGVAMPVIFITADGDRNVRARALATGAVDFLAKPFSDRALLSAVEEALGQPPSP